MRLLQNKPKPRKQVGHPRQTAGRTALGSENRHFGGLERLRKALNRRWHWGGTIKEAEPKSKGLGVAELEARPAVSVPEDKPERGWAGRKGMGHSGVTYPVPDTGLVIYYLL